MKKLVTTLLICLLSVICVFAFTACDLFKTDSGDKDNTEQDGGNEEVKYTVTEEEWKEAISLFDIYDKEFNADIDKIESKKDKLNFKVVENYSIEGSIGNYILEIDYKDNIFISKLGKNYVKYDWGKNGQYFSSSYDGKLERVSEEDFYASTAMIFYSVTSYIWLYLGNVESLLVCNYSDFTFENETNTYIGTIFFKNEPNEPNGPIMDCKLKFINGQLIEVFLEYAENEFMNYSIEYGVQVTIPDEILNLAN